MNQRLLIFRYGACVPEEGCFREWTHRRVGRGCSASRTRHETYRRGTIWKRDQRRGRSATCVCGRQQRSSGKQFTCVMHGHGRWRSAPAALTQTLEVQDASHRQSPVLPTPAALAAGPALAEPRAQAPSFLHLRQGWFPRRWRSRCGSWGHAGAQRDDHVPALRASAHAGASSVSQQALVYSPEHVRSLSERTTVLVTITSDGAAMPARTACRSSGDSQTLAGRSLVAA
jgi:hypothetical protein